MILGILCGGGGLAVVAALVIMALSRNGGKRGEQQRASKEAATAPRGEPWRMPPLDQLPPARLFSLAAKTWMSVLRLRRAITTKAGAFPNLQNRRKVVSTFSGMWLHLQQR